MKNVHRPGILQVVWEMVPKARAEKRERTCSLFGSSRRRRNYEAVSGGRSETEKAIVCLHVDTITGSLIWGQTSQRLVDEQAGMEFDTLGRLESIPLTA